MKFKITCLLLALTLINGCSIITSSNENKQRCSFADSLDTPIYSTFKSDFHVKQSDKIYEYLASDKNIKTIYFENVKGFKNNKSSILLAKRSFYSVGFNIDMECYNANREYLSYDAHISSSFIQSEGKLSLITRIKSKTEEKIITTTNTHNYSTLKF
jgi:hypothetical protein